MANWKATIAAFLVAAAVFGSVARAAHKMSSYSEPLRGT